MFVHEWATTSDGRKVAHINHIELLPTGKQWSNLDIFYGGVNVKIFRQITFSKLHFCC